jgi:hypothetical protein
VNTLSFGSAQSAHLGLATVSIKYNCRKAYRTQLITFEDLPSLPRLGNSERSRIQRGSEVDESVAQVAPVIRSHYLL